MINCKMKKVILKSRGMMIAKGCEAYLVNVVDKSKKTKLQ